MYQMSLVNDGIYLPVMVKRFSLVENESNLMNIPLIVEALSIVKVSIFLLIHYDALVILIFQFV